MEDENYTFAMKKADSLPVVFENKNLNCECYVELNKLRDELQQRNNIISSLRNQVKELEEENTRMKRREQQLDKKFQICEKCTIQ